MLFNRHFIFPGRFQPFHNDHDAVVQRFLQDFPDAILCLAIVFDFAIDEASADDYDIQSIEHFRPERNPWSPWQRLSSIQGYIRSLGTSRLLTTLIPRPSRLHSWKIIDGMFPIQRTWIIPACGEAWDDKKADFFKEMGDEVVRISITSQVDGLSIRNALAQKQFDFVVRSVPVAIWKAIETLL